MHAGQWLDTFVPATSGAGGFTITSSPSAASSALDPYFELAVQKSPGNPHAAWFWRPVKDIVNQSLQVRVGGSFIYPPREAHLRTAKRVVLVAGGVGINPLVSMMGEMADTAAYVEVKVLYGSKVSGGTLRDVLFLERMAQMFRDGGLQGSVDVFLSGATESAVQSEAASWLQDVPIRLQTGRMTAQQVKDTISAGSRKDTLMYICGPPTMTDELAAAVGDQGNGVIAAERVMTEKWW